MDGSMMGAGQYTDYMWNSLGPRVGVPPQMLGNPGMAAVGMPGYMGPNFLLGPTVDMYQSKHASAETHDSPHKNNKNYLLYGAMAVVGALALWKGGSKAKKLIQAIPDVTKKGYEATKTFFSTHISKIKAKIKK